MLKVEIFHFHALGGDAGEGFPHVDGGEGTEYGEGFPHGGCLGDGRVRVLICSPVVHVMHK